MGLSLNISASSLKEIEAACDAGYGKACLDLGNMYNEGTNGVVVDGVKAMALFTKSCDNNHTMGCSYLGDVYSYVGENGNKEAFLLALKFYKKACNNGGGMECYNVSYMLYNGQGAEQDYKASKEYAIKACDTGFAAGCLNAGNRYVKGQGAKQDYEKALYYFKRACDGNIGKACYNLANMYDDAKGTHRDTTKTIMYYEKSCELPGDELSPAEARGCGVLASLYEKGIWGFKKDTKKATELYKKACGRSDKNSVMGKIFCGMIK